MFDVGDLVWILSSDESGTPMPNQAPVLIIGKYEGVPRAFIHNDKANEEFMGTERKTIYDILCDGIIEKGIDEEWLTVLSDEDILRVCKK